jgi:hypothetical protein
VTVAANGGDVAATPMDMDIVRDELLWAIEDAINNHPRSQQVRIGPSEIGIECARRIGYKLLNHPEVNDRGVPWKPTIGTAVHTWLEEVFGKLNAKLGVQDRFLLEQTVDVGEIGGQTITGHCDVYDSVTASVIDWKVVGGEQLSKYRKFGPGGQYRAQAHLYGRGWQRQGRPVQNVAVMFLPRDRELNMAHFWHEPYDESVATTALTRAEGIAKLTGAAGTAALGLLPTADIWCRYCPYFSAGSKDLVGDGCPGDPRAPRPGNSIQSLIA